MLRRPAALGPEERIPPAQVAHPGHGERGLRLGLALWTVAGQGTRRAQFCAFPAAPFADVGYFALGTVRQGSIQ